MNSSVNPTACDQMALSLPNLRPIWLRSFMWGRISLFVQILTLNLRAVLYRHCSYPRRERILISIFWCLSLHQSKIYIDFFFYQAVHHAHDVFVIPEGRCGGHQLFLGPTSLAFARCLGRWECLYAFKWHLWKRSMAPRRRNTPHSGAPLGYLLGSVIRSRVSSKSLELRAKNPKLMDVGWSQGSTKPRGSGISGWLFAHNGCIPTVSVSILPSIIIWATAPV